MAKGEFQPIRIAADVAATAVAVAPLENRTEAEQINYWLRLGMLVERSTSLSNRRALAAVSRGRQFSQLTPEERIVAHATIDARLAERVASQRFGM